MSFRPTLTAVAPGEHLVWLGHLGLPGVFDGRHSCGPEALGVDVTRLIQTEEFSGCLVPLMGTLLERTRAGFEAMNDALRVRVESAVTGQSMTIHRP